MDWATVRWKLHNANFNRFQPTVLKVAFMLSVCMSSQLVCIVRIDLWLNGASESKLLLLTAYRKSYMRNRLVPK